MGLQQRAGDDSPYHVHEVPAVAKPCLRPAQVLVCDSRHPASGDAGVFHLARWWRWLHQKTRAPAPAPNSADQRCPFGDSTAWWAARSRVAPGCAPPDGDDGAPGRGRLRPVSGGVDHRPCSRPPQLSTPGTIWGGKEKEEQHWGAGEGAGVAATQGGGGVAMRPPPASSSRCGDSCGGGTGVSLEATEDKQTTIKS
jgi:hypothetical protein